MALFSQPAEQAVNIHKEIKMVENTDNGNDLWLKTLKIIKRDLNNQSFQTWFSPTTLISSTEKLVKVAVPNKFFKDWLIEHYRPLIKKALGVNANKKINVEFVVQPPEKKPTFSQKQKTPTQQKRLNHRYSFDNFVVGSGNRFAHAASMAVAQSPARAYNPLFIYGSVGLGKTHLLQAISGCVTENNKDGHVVYISSERFTNQLISAIQNKTTLRFRQKYRTVDVLLIDDIHFIAGKESTQEEFFHTFNTLYDAHKQIVLSSDRPPKEIPGLEERLVSRFEWGLITDIQPPDLETRIAILKKKLERETAAVPDDVIFFIASKIKSNIRELEGALIRVVAYASLLGEKINTQLAQQVLKNTLDEEAKKITIELIQKRVAEYFDVRISDMRAKKRSRVVVYPRQIAMYLVRELTDHSLPEIGEFFGGRDHTTILYAHNKIKKGLKNNQKLEHLLGVLSRSIKN
ncbi:MAG: chromosomal replication initiator protein DnaA [Candidatus Omnitrophota bacterium]|nr:chromosomal replication initiator protein DnaA [Candidatus Omnitrophota bacterium]